MSSHILLLKDGTKTDPLEHVVRTESHSSDVTCCRTRRNFLRNGQWWRPQVNNAMTQWDNVQWWKTGNVVYWWSRYLSFYILAIR